MWCFCLDNRVTQRIKLHQSLATKEILVNFLVLVILWDLLSNMCHMTYPLRKLQKGRQSESVLHLYASRQTSLWCLCSFFLFLLFSVLWQRQNDLSSLLWVIHSVNIHLFFCFSSPWCRLPCYMSEQQHNEEERQAGRQQRGERGHQQQQQLTLLLHLHQRAVSHRFTLLTELFWVERAINYFCLVQFPQHLAH